jgi:multicomponent Na+:H+ antiporter subunit D
MVAIPLFAAVLNALVGKFSTRARQGISIATTLVLIALAAILLKSTLDGNRPVYHIGGWPPPIGINLVADSLSALMALVISFIGFLCIAYSISYMKGYTGRPMYDSLLMFMIAGMMGVVLTGDLFNMFVFFEIFLIASYALVAFRGGPIEMRASFKYAVLSMIGMSAFLIGIGLVYNVTGTLNMAHVAKSIGTMGSPAVLAFAGGALITGVGVVSAIVPLHTWLPDAHPAAPSPVSALLSGVAVKVGFYGIIRIVCTMYGFQHIDLIGPVIIALGLLTMVVGAALAFVQTDIKRLLAYSTIGSMGYITVGLGLGTSTGIQGATFHIMNHALAKAMLFLIAGCVIHRVGTRNMHKMGGLLGRAPVEATAFLLGGLAVAGVPPLNGFFSKLLIYQGLFDAGQFMPFIISIAISLFFLAIYLRAFQMIFLGKSSGKPERIKTPATMLAPVLILAIVILVIGILPNFGLGVTSEASKQVLDNAAYIRAVL